MLNIKLIKYFAVVLSTSWILNTTRTYIYDKFLEIINKVKCSYDKFSKLDHGVVVAPKDGL